MQEFEEANIGGQPQGIPTAPQDQTFQITTDDLVFMIGEQSIIDLKSELVALKSLSAASQDGGEWSAQEPAKPAKKGE